MRIEIRNLKTEGLLKADGRDGNGGPWAPRFRMHGFTLLELLLAVLVFAVVLGAIHVVFFSALRLRNRTSESIERTLPLQQTLAIIKRDLQNIVPPGGTLSGSLQSTPTNSISTSRSRQGNGPQFYTATATVDDNAPWGEIQRVSYYLAEPTNATPGLDLYRSVARNLLPVVRDETEDQFLMSGVEAITFQYYDGNAWKDTWDSTVEDTATGLTNLLPMAIKVQLQLYNEDYRSGDLFPVEMVVPIPVQARTNAPVSIAEVTP